ncbi:cell division protein FtsQ/DivIB [Sphingomonas solaris]|uniref:Cell division protein FtsQ n=1 Tax=Alterirhizorhabdus solaris TaxID=2529389 RepID=A0A558QYC7_9SPHN|nr:cell division protein FtsQ/DivIB [Sphingomonas solaris]TVV72163.1 FtsQ-type POTRA domain-containing protein [Sphingomonas solaris]
MTARAQPATIRRGAPPRKRTPAKPRVVVKTQAQANRALAIMPPGVASAARIAGRWLIVLLLVAGAIFGFIAMGLPQMVGTEIGELIGRAGFAVKRIEITGIDRMDRRQVENASLDQTARAMPLVDLGEIRQRLLQQGWVKDARVSRRFPDTLVIDIVERQPAAIWQYQRRLALVDADGRVIEQVRLEGTPLPDLPIVIGPGANRRLDALADLLKAAPQLKPMLDGATWVGDRRWDIRFRSGETLSLPEGDAQARDALVDFAKRDGVARLLGQGIVRFDMRVPGRFVVRVKDPVPPPAIDTPTGGATTPAAVPRAAPPPVDEDGTSNT